MWRAGSKLAGPERARRPRDHVTEGVSVFEKEMNIMKIRKTFLKAITKKIRFNSHLRDLPRKTLLDEIEVTTHEEVAQLFEEFLGVTEAGNRVTY